MFAAWEIQVGHEERLFHQEAGAALQEVTQRVGGSSILGGSQSSATQSGG